jgi:protein-L-isoaspartate O-methyltransferase
MWSDAEVVEGHTILQVGTGSGYATALACERLGSSHVTSVDIDPRRLDVAANALYDCGYTPTLAVADGRYGYWPEAWFDRIVTACSFRSVPQTLLAQTRPGGKVLLQLSGWLGGHARVLLTVSEDGAAEGPLLPSTVSFTSARTLTPPVFGHPADWTAGLTAQARSTQHSPKRITASTAEASVLRFLVQCSLPSAQLLMNGSAVHLIDVVSGSAASLVPEGDSWRVREGGPMNLWERIEQLVSAFDAAGRPGAEHFVLCVDQGKQHVRWAHAPVAPVPLPRADPDFDRALLEGVDLTVRPKREARGR